MVSPVNEQRIEENSTDGSTSQDQNNENKEEMSPKSEKITISSDKKRKELRRKNKFRKKSKSKKNKKTEKNNFTKLGLNETIKIPFAEPTNIQKEVIPQLIEKQDVIAIAKTGSGKTLSFILPILNDTEQEDYLQALIIVPTRELCHQIYFVLEKYKQKNFKIQKIIGGLTEKKEVKKLIKCQILVATPGRLLQYLLEQEGLDLRNLKYLIIDEFDKMIEFGFVETLKEILNSCKTDCLSLFSATYKNEFLSENVLKQNHPKLCIDYSSTNIEKYYTIMRLNEKIDNLYSILNSDEKFIIFCSTTKAAKFHYLLFEKIFNCYLLTSDCSQKNRLQSFDSFNNLERGILFCTDLASRGLDFRNVNTVIQFDRPDDLQTFIHRSGRCGRQDTYGKVYLFLLESEKKFLEETCDIKEVKVFKRKLNFSKMFKKNSQLKEFAEKYIRTYEKHLLLNNKKFPNSVDEIKSLKDYLIF